MNPISIRQNGRFRKHLLQLHEYRFTNHTHGRTEEHAMNRHIQYVGQDHQDGVVEFMTPEYHYCPRCGTKLESQDEHGVPRPTCSKCGFIAYYNPVPAVGGVIVRDGEVLLVQRAFEPKKGLWSLPAGFMEYGERQVDALAREVKEETALDVRSASLLSVEDAADDPRTHALLIAFYIEEWAGEPQAGDDASDVRWWPLAVNPPDMAWRNHTRVLELARERAGIQA